MKVETEVKDRFGRYCHRFDTTDLKKIYEWLWNEYGGDGYKFAIVIDVSLDVDFEPQKQTYVYFLDEIEDELKAYKG